MRLRKSEDIKRKEEEPNTWYTGKVMEMRMTHGYPGPPWEMQENYYLNIYNGLLIYKRKQNSLDNWQPTNTGITHSS
jgi:hypothetical protein